MDATVTEEGCLESPCSDKTMGVSNSRKPRLNGCGGRGTKGGCLDSRREEGPGPAVCQTNKAGLTLNRFASAWRTRGLMPRLPFRTSEIVATGKLV
jgi:hypothetical protein